MGILCRIISRATIVRCSVLGRFHRNIEGAVHIRPRYRLFRDGKLMATESFRDFMSAYGISLVVVPLQIIWLVVIIVDRRI